MKQKKIKNSRKSYSRKRKEEVKEKELSSSLNNLEVIKTREGYSNILKEVDKLSEELAKKDLELSQLKEKREKELIDLERSKNELTALIQDIEKSRKALLNILEDVDFERKKAQEERNKTFAIINSLADGVLFIDYEDKVSLVNPQAEIMLDLKKEDIFGKRIIDLNVFPNIKPFLSLLGEGVEKVFRKEVKIKENVVFEITTVPILEKEHYGKLIILHDISREKLVEKMKTEFVSLAAHQLRTPLSAIKWILKMFLDREVGEISEEQEDFLQKAYQSNERTIALINDLLNVTRIEEGRYIYQTTLTSIESVINPLINSYQDEFSRKKINFEFKKPKSALPYIHLDVEKITLALQNLFDNAIRYTKEGGTIVVSLEHDDKKKEVKFSISDNGVGIPDNEKERIFTKFFRGTNVIRMETEGSGLGLFIAKNIVEAHKGRIWFESEEGKGSTFYIAFPIKEEVREFLEKL